MQIKLDENLPNELAQILAGLAHDVDTVLDEGLAGCDDASVWLAVQQTRRFFVTQDLDFSDIRQFTPGTHPGILLVRLENASRAALIHRVRQIFENEDVTDFSGCLVVATEHKLRIRRP
jgi:predicted nuclease of predicted toxin-antitoxin system